MHFEDFCISMRICAVTWQRLSASKRLWIWPRSPIFFGEFFLSGVFIFFQYDTNGIFCGLSLESFEKFWFFQYYTDCIFRRVFYLEFWIFFKCSSLNILWIIYQEFWIVFEYDPDCTIFEWSFYQELLIFSIWFQLHILWIITESFE